MMVVAIDVGVIDADSKIPFIVTRMAKVSMGEKQGRMGQHVDRSQAIRDGGSGWVERSCICRAHCVVEKEAELRNPRA